jgi:arginine/lysine/ornithine decarboxylase
LALHHYDPKDLSTDFQQDTSPPSMPLISAADTNAKEKESKSNKHMTLQEEEMEEAADMGLQVEFLKGEEVVEDQDVFVDKTQENGDLWKDECANDEDFVDFDDSDDDDLL